MLHTAPYGVYTRRRAGRALARRARRLVANNCTPVWTSTQCSCPRREQSKKSIVCELHCPSTACEHMRRARTSAPCGVQACHACTHLLRPGGLPLMQMACSARKETVAAPCHQLRSVGVVSANLRAQTNARTAPQRFELFAWDLQPALQGPRLQCWLRMREVCHAMPRHGARLRAR